MTKESTSRNSSASFLQIILAGGCFWGLEELLRDFRGVIATEVGYTGGDLVDPTYEDVKTGQTRHAEAVRITFDPKIVNLAEIFAFFFRIHDPTTLNRQGGDRGTQYRSAIFANDAQVIHAAKLAIADAAKLWAEPIVTTIEPLGDFYSAEEYHQDYLRKNPGGYSCHFLRK